VSPAQFLDALADCLDAGSGLEQAIDRLLSVGGTTGLWAQRLRRASQGGVPVAGALRAAGLVDEEEQGLLSSEGADARIPGLLRALAVRRRRLHVRSASVARGLVGPLVVGLVTLLLDPVSSLVVGGSFFGPLLRDLCLLGIPALAVLVGLPALASSVAARRRALTLCVRVPGARGLARMHAEEELLTVLGPFVDGGEVSPGGLGAAASVLSWSPIAGALRAARISPRPPASPLAMGGLEQVAGHLTEATRLTLVGGAASRRLAERITAHAEATAVTLTGRLRLLLRVGAYALIVLVSLASLGGLMARGVPGLSTIPGGSTSEESRELEELMKQMGQP
jgi:hypothetical protein